MEDSTGVDSNDSTTISEEFELVNETPVVLPQLKIAGDGSVEGLWQCLEEMLSEEGEESKAQPSVNGVAESQDEGQLLELADIPQDCTIFNGVSYLGSATVNAPKSDTEIQRNMAIFNAQSVEPIKVSVSIPSYSDGSVVLYDQQSNSVIARYEISRILFFAHGKPSTKEEACFSFTWSHGDSIESSIHQCHIFRCDIPEAVSQVSSCFMKAFQRIPKSMTTSVNGDLPNANELSSNCTQFILEVTVEIKEDDGKGGFSTVPRDRNGFKLRVNTEKQVCLLITQVASESHRLLEIKRCFGVLVSHGHNVKIGDMQLLDMVTMGSAEGGGYAVTAAWNPDRPPPALAPLNTAVADAPAKPFTVAVDLVIAGVPEPVRLVVETSARVFSHGERFWMLQRRNLLVQPFYLNVKEIGSAEESSLIVTSIETSGEVDRLNKLNLTLNNLASYIRSPSISSIDALTPSNDYNSDGDEPLMSGTGDVSKDCSATELEEWKEVLTQWKDIRPRCLPPLVKQGIPEALRGEVWQRLADIDSALMKNYPILMGMESNFEQAIKRDIHRTFPAHEFFKEGSSSKGQDALSRISKAYSVYDTEVGYCQGLSFLAATLLLHMPEEQAFCVLVKLMYGYGLRDLYKDGFECLYLRLYQLNRLLDDQLPALSQHFKEIGLETHMFASQWFLTLYTARFPLYFVFHIIDVFLLQGTETLFQVALALLMMCKKDLLTLDFEATLKYFRVTLPKKCRNDDVARNLMKFATSNIKLKKLKKYENEFMALKEAQENADQYSNELERLKNELLRSDEEKKRLENELYQIKKMLKREVQKAETDNMKNASIISEYKSLNQQLDSKLQLSKGALNDLRAVVANCETCSTLEKQLDSSVSAHQASTSPDLVQRVTELELELAQAKLAHVEAECRNQDLSHQLSCAAAEAAQGNGWPPWLSRTFSTIREAAVAKAREAAVSKPPIRHDSGDHSPNRA